MDARTSQDLVVLCSSIVRRESLAGPVLLLAAAVSVLATPVYGYDFTLARLGSHQVVQGYPHYSLLVMILAEGTRDYAEVFVSGLPPGGTHDFPDARLYCCGVREGIGRLWEPRNSRLLIEVGAATPPGKYDIVVRARSASVERQVTFPLFVHPARALDKRPAKTIPPIPELARWESMMKSAYKARCDPDQIAKMSIGWEAADWYYDGAWVRYQIAEYTGNPAWARCGDAIATWYGDKAVGGLPGWRVFSHGLRVHYERTQEQRSLDALRALISSSAFGSSGGGVSTDLIRETAFMIQTYISNERTGAPPFFHQMSASRESIGGLKRSVAYGIGQLDQLIESSSSGRVPTYHQPFMVGLMLDALIEYYEFERARGFTDPRIPWVVQRAAEWLWQTAWIGSSETFYYDNKNFQPAADLNLLIAPAYAWLWQQMGDPTYQDRGDRIFAGGVRGGWAGGGKQFNQAYRWSIRYVQWRSKAPGN